MISKTWMRTAGYALLVSQVGAQLTLTGCHLDKGVEVCFLPGGAETTIAPASAARTSTPASVAASTTATAQTTAITDCHMHGATQYCVKGDGAEVQVLATATGTAALPTQYSGCHAHGAAELFCETPDGREVEVVVAGAKGGAGDGHSEQHAEGENCHFHAGVEHCGSHSEKASAANCERRDRNYDVNLRVGLLFVILATSAIAVYAPMAMTKLLKLKADGMAFTIVKQFGTGVIISTGFIHLLTHAELMFGNSCLGELEYEATATAIAMAGAFLAFLVDYIAHRLAHWRRSKSAVVPGQPETTTSSIHDESTSEGVPHSKEATAVSSSPPLAAMSHHHAHHSLVSTSNDAISVLVLEAGIIFHSLLIGITLVVAGDSVFITLFVVIIFHQMFEGLALGARIATLPTSTAIKKTKFFILPLAFALVTPTGMAIGIGVLNTFNGNDPSTIIALGTLDAISAGILLWVGFVDMWASDWLFGELREAPLVKTLIALGSFMAGMALMGLLGKWA